MPKVRVNSPFWPDVGPPGAPAGFSFSDTVPLPDAPANAPVPEVILEVNWSGGGENPF
jgi:hypothetical protein